MNRTCRGLLAASLLGAGPLFGAGIEYEAALIAATNLDNTEQTLLRDQAIATLKARFNQVCVSRIFPLTNDHILIRLADLPEDPNFNPRGVITGSFTTKEAFEFQRILGTPMRDGALSIVAERPLDPEVEREMTRVSEQTAVKRVLLAFFLFLIGLLFLLVVVILYWRRMKKKALAPLASPPLRNLHS